MVVFEPDDSAFSGGLGKLPVRWVSTSALAGSTYGVAGRQGAGVFC